MIPIRIPLAGLALVVQACAVPAERTARESDSAHAGPASPTSRGAEVPDSVLLAGFQAFLDSAVVTRRDSSSAVAGRPERCEADAIIPAVDYLLAAGRALAVTRRTSDLATVRAELTVVGEDSLSDAGVRRIDLGVRTDTVEWDMASDSSGAWYPCGYASTDRDLGRMGTQRFPATWVPTGTGWGTVARLTDSVRQARGLTP
jgi:hypothetical protein